jgi:hypothetical protein
MLLNPNAFSSSEENNPCASIARSINQLAPPMDAPRAGNIRMLDAGNALKQSPDYELQRLTTQTAFGKSGTHGRSGIGSLVSRGCEAFWMLGTPAESVRRALRVEVDQID